MKDTENLHKKVQEHCDCFATTDYLAEMSKVKHDADKEDAAPKWLALAALHGVNSGAKEVSIYKDKSGNVKVVAEYRDAELPSPGAEIAEKIFETVREITHIEDKKGKTDLALGIRDSSINLKIKVKQKDDKDKITIKFPE
ncbi:MAG: hypothetical protein R6U27_06130 [Desulfobacterales bacterium]